MAITSSFNDWLSDQGLAEISDGTTQSYFSVHYTAWLTEIFNTAEVREWLLENHGIALDAAITVKLNQNDSNFEAAPYIEVAGQTYNVFQDFFDNRTDVDLKTGKVTQERWYSDLFTFGNANEAPTDIRLTIHDDLVAAVNGVGPPSAADQPANTTTGDGTVIGTLSAADPDAGDTHTFEIVAGDTRFEIVNGNTLQLKSGESIDEGNGTFTLTVKVTDSASNEYFETFTFVAGTSASDNDATAPDITALEGTENSGLGTSVSPVTGDDVIFGFRGNDVLNIEEDGGVVVFGTSGDDALFGGRGNDQLHGGDGNDQLFGGAQNDTLTGGSGADIMSGGDGNDTFVWLAGDMQNTADDNFDTIIGWSASGDTLDVSDLLASFGFDPDADVLTDWLSVTNDGTHTTVAVDVDGNGSGYSNLVLLQNFVVTDVNAFLSGKVVVE